MHIKKHLSFSGLRKILSNCFNGIEDKRQREKVDYSLHDALMSGFACMYFQDPTLCQFQKRLQENQNRSNLQTIFAVKGIPKDNQLRNIIDEVPSEELRLFFKDYFYKLQRGKHLNGYQIIPGHYLCPIDATGYFSSDSICCPGCLTTEHIKAEDEESKKTTYAHKSLQVAIVHPDKKQVIPLMPEEIKNTDGKTKQDCEINGAKRLIPKLRRDHPQLNLIMLGDDLYSRQPMINLVRSKKMHYLFVTKPESHKYLQEWIDIYKRLNRDEYRNYKGEHYIVEWMHGVPLNGQEDSIQVNYLRCQVYKKDKKTGKEKRTYQNSWVTDININKKNAYQLARGARCRWKVENECFNTLKNQGYHIEHNYGHGEKNLCFNFYLLTLIAFAFHQVFELTDKLYQASRIKFGSKNHMWESLRSYIKIIVFETWEHLLRFALKPDNYKLQLAQPPPA